MGDVTLVPAMYRCPDHDNVDTMTALVRARIEWEVDRFGDRARSPFRVAVFCPGTASAPAHRRICDGEWLRA